MSQSLKVTILGTDYSLRSNDEAQTKQLASDVDAEMSELQAKLPAQSTTTLAVLGALNFAEREAHARSNEQREIERVADEMESLAATLERALSER